MAVDPTVLTFPRMCMATAYDENGPILYLPFQSCLVVDCIAPRPGADKRELSFAYWQIGQQLEKAMKDTGNCDCYATINDADLADSMCKHGWTEIRNVRLLRKRIAAPTLPEDTNARNN
jgi:hypothetical protein